VEQSLSAHPLEQGEELRAFERLVRGKPSPEHVLVDPCPTLVSSPSPFEEVVGGGVENLSQFNSDREPKVRAPRKCFYVAVLMGFIMSHKFSTLAYFRGFTKPHRFLASWPKKVIGHLPLCLPGCTTCTTPPPRGDSHFSDCTRRFGGKPFLLRVYRAPTLSSD